MTIVRERPAHGRRAVAPATWQTDPSWWTVDPTCHDTAATTHALVCADLAATAATPAALAAHWQVDVEFVTELIRARFLYAVDDPARGWVVPLFQLDGDGRPIPGAGTLLQDLPVNLPPVAALALVGALRSTASPVLPGDDGEIDLTAVLLGRTPELS